MAKNEKKQTRLAAADRALSLLIRTIEGTGGVIQTEEGHLVPWADPDWIDLGEAYRLACESFGREPKIVEDVE